MSPYVRRLALQDAEAFQALRLAALQESPTAFGSSFDEEKDLPAAAIEGRLALKSDRGPFGAFDGRHLVGLAALGRENLKNLSHKALLWGVYVQPPHRGRGIARALLNEVVVFARSVPGVTQINLSVNASLLPAIRLYESFGFAVYGCEPDALVINGERFAELHMSLSLRHA